MKTIYKYDLPVVTGIVSINLPRGAEILTLQPDPHGHSCIWALVDSSQPLEIREFEVCWTGKPMQDIPETTPRHYIGTVITGPIVSHIFELKLKCETMKNTTMIDGIMYACQYLVLTRDEPTFAEELMRESGFTYQEFINAQARTAHEDRKMNRVILMAFSKHKPQHEEKRDTEDFGNYAGIGFDDD